MSILNYVPAGYILRDVQRTTLLEVERNWNNVDVFCLDLSVAAGKSLVAATISEWRKAYGDPSNIIVPHIIHQNVYEESFDYPSLKGQDRYKCNDKDYLRCKDRFYSLGYKCKSCAYNKTLRQAISSPIAVCNYHSYMNQAYVGSIIKPVLIADEAHNLVRFLNEKYTTTLWDFPDKLHTKDHIIQWFEKEIKRLYGILQDPNCTPVTRKKYYNTYSKYNNILEGMTENKEEFLAERRELTYYGNKRTGMYITPLSVCRLNVVMWGKQVEKIVLMSASLNEKIDLNRLGLGNRRAMWISGKSPIPVENRPLINEWVGKMTRKHSDANFPKLVAKIKELADRHQGKGFVHATYDLANKLREHLDNPRFVFHNKDDKEERLHEYMNSANKVFIGSGLSEGLSLNGHDFEWQAITKVQYPSLVDPINKHNINNNQDLYNWETALNLIQMYGRICRAPTDKGITYMLDRSFQVFYIKNRDMFPEYFQQAITEGNK